MEEMPSHHTHSPSNLKAPSGKQLSDSILILIPIQMYSQV